MTPIPNLAAALASALALSASAHAAALKDEILFDAKSLKKLESFGQADVPVEKRPDWSSSSDRYTED